MVLNSERCHSLSRALYASNLERKMSNSTTGANDLAKTAYRQPLYAQEVPKETQFRRAWLSKKS
jgi:hypothetical protein